MNKILKIKRGGIYFLVIVNEEKKIVVARNITSIYFQGPFRNKKGCPDLKISFAEYLNNVPPFVGKAKCSDTDIWKVHFGINLAIQRCYDKMCDFVMESILQLQNKLEKIGKQIKRIPKEEMDKWVLK